MTVRSFVDPAGVSWLVYDVHPRAAGRDERRSGYDRRLEPAPDPIVERRTGTADRRRRQGVEEIFGLTHPGFEGGWLCFQAEGEKRRLAPIPPQWTEASDAALAALLARARPAPRSGSAEDASDATP